MKKIQQCKQVPIHTETTYIKFFIEMRLKGHPFMFMVPQYLLKILQAFKK